MTHDEKQLRDLANDTLNTLTMLRDEAKVRMHLASMDARDAWQDAEPHMLRMEERLRTALDGLKVSGTEKLRLELHLGLAEARDRMATLEPKARAFGTALTDKGREAFETLKANLAKVRAPH